MFGFFKIPALLSGEKTVGDLPSEKELYSTFLKLAWPSVIEAVLVGLVGLVDSLMVATLGDTAIAAVGITQQPKLIMMCFVFAVNIGITAVVARRKGENKREEANHAMRNGMMIAAGIVLITSTIGFLCAEPFLRFAGANDDYIADSIVYFRIIAFSIVFQCLNGSINAAQKGSSSALASASLSLTGLWRT